jgi:transposase
VGIDLHRRRLVIVRVTGEGEVLEVVRIVNDPVALCLELARAGPDPEVALEATYGWYWAADLLVVDGARVHLVYPLGLHWDARRVKNDERDATELAHRLRRGDLPGVLDRAGGGARAAGAHRLSGQRLAALRTSAKAQIHAVMAKLGILPSMSDMFGPTGQALLDAMAFEGAYAIRVASLRGLLERYEDELVMVEHQLHGRLADHKGYNAIQALNGVGRITAAIMVAEIGDVARFPDAGHLCSWAGLTPTHRESDTKVQRGHITKQGSTLVRWAAIEAVARYHGGAAIAAAFTRIATRRGVMIARVAAARKLLSLIFYGLRDGEIRCLVREAG